MEKLLAKVTEIKYLTQTIVELHTLMVEPQSIIFQAGQFVQFQIQNEFRSYSIVSAPGSAVSRLVFCIELLEKGVGSDFVRSLKVGDQIYMRGPLGTFTIQDRSRNIFFIATGVGVAPFRSMIADLLSGGYKNKVKLLFGLRSEENVFYYDSFRTTAKFYPNLQFIPLLSRPQSHWPGEVGRVSTYIDSLYAHYGEYVFYLCGSKDMVVETRSILLKHNHPMRDIKLEIFI